MKKQLFFAMFTVLTISDVHATIKRVGYAGIPQVSGVDYASFYFAYAAATDGDTIYVFPGKSLAGVDWPTAYDRPEIAKRLVIISKGYWTDSTSNPKGNAGLQASKGTAYFGENGNQTVYFLSSSAGSVLMGFDGRGISVGIQANNITIKRNFNLSIYLDNVSISGLTVEGNYRVWFGGNDNVNQLWSNVVIKNNFIYQFLLPLKTYSGTINNNTWISNGVHNVSGQDLTTSYYNTSGTYLSNINLRDGTWFFQNNLMLFYTSANATSNVNYFVITGADNSTISYNLALQSYNFTVWPGTASGNVFLDPANVATVCAGFPTLGSRTADDKYVLASGSPALKTNLPAGSPSDAGMYGGSTPYKLGMIPSIPTIYRISSPQGNNPSGNTITINLSTRSNN